MSDGSGDGGQRDPDPEPVDPFPGKRDRARTEYEFRGRMDGRQAALASVLTVRGRDVHVTLQGITVTPQVMPGTG